MTNKVYVVSYITESGDRGVVGYWDKKPSEGQLTAYFKKLMPDEFIKEDDGEEYCLIFWDVFELEALKLPKAVKVVPTI